MSMHHVRFALASVVVAVSLLWLFFLLFESHVPRLIPAHSILTQIPVEVHLMHGDASHVRPGRMTACRGGDE